MAQRQVHKSARGREIDMTKLVTQNEMTLAVGNAKVNARGDKIGPGGQIVKKREEIIAERSNAVIPNQVPVRDPEPVSQTAQVKLGKKDISKQDPEGNDE
jgi:hypothetical protein